MRRKKKKSFYNNEYSNNHINNKAAIVPTTNLLWECHKERPFLLKMRRKLAILFNLVYILEKQNTRISFLIEWKEAVQSSWCSSHTGVTSWCYYFIEQWTQSFYVAYNTLQCNNGAVLYYMHENQSFPDYMTRLL
mgnify:CR=1 FL=1